MFIKSQEVFNLLSTDGHGPFDPFQYYTEEELKTPEIEKVKSLLNKKFNNKFIAYSYALKSHDFDISKLFVKNQYEIILDLYKKHAKYKIGDELPEVNPFSDSLFLASVIIDELKSYLCNNEELDSIRRDTGDGYEEYHFYKDFVLYSGVIIDNDLMIFPCDENYNMISHFKELISINLLTILNGLTLSKTKLTEEQIPEIKAIERKLELEAT